MTTNPTTRRATVEGWLTQPPAHQGRTSEGHTSSVNVLRMVNTRHQHTTTEPVPFRARPAPLRNIRFNEPRHGAGCGGSGIGLCLGHPDCADHQCQGHPDNTEGEGLEDNARALAIFWRWYLGAAAVVLAVVGYSVLG